MNDASVEYHEFNSGPLVGSTLEIVNTVAVTIFRLHYPTNATGRSTIYVADWAKPQPRPSTMPLQESDLAAEVFAHHGPLEAVLMASIAWPELHRVVMEHIQNAPALDLGASTMFKDLSAVKITCSPARASEAKP